MDDSHDPKRVEAAIDISLGKLGLGYVDLYQYVFGILALVRQVTTL